MEGRSGPEEGGPETCKSKWVPLAESPHAHVISDVAPSPRAKRRSFDDEYAHVTSTCAANTAPAAPPIRNLRHLPEQEVCTQATLKVSNGVKWWSSDDDSVHAHSTSTAGIDMAATPHGNLIRFSEQAVLMDATLVKSNGIALIGEKSHGPMKYRRHAPMGVETWLKNRASRMRGAMAVALEMEHAVAAVACSRTDMGFAQVQSAHSSSFDRVRAFHVAYAFA